MIFIPTKLEGAFIIELDRREDERGFFARSFCADEFTQHGLNPCVAQCNVSFNAQAGTLRGMHFQLAPHAEAKLVRCTMGAAFDVMVDLRPSSPTYKQWVGVELIAHNHRAVYIPEGFAHGAQTLTDNTELFYQMSAPYVGAASSGVRWDDPAFGITWPQPPDGNRIIAERDQAWPDFVA
jgi:dTDP-4-dehydrorhamnose 3,5-epimerase